MSPTPLNKPTTLRSLSSFSVILIMVVLMVVGLVLTPLLNIQYAPSTKRNHITVYFGYSNASARVTEQEVTSKIEGALSAIDGVDEVYAGSRFGGGSITIQFKESKKIDVARFEIATQIRQIYSSLPEGTSYPAINMSSSGEGQNHIFTYTINADMPPEAISKFANQKLIPELAKIKGMESATLSGASPFYWVISYDPDIMQSAGVTVQDITGAFNSNYSNDIVGMASQGNESISITLKSQPEKDMLNIPVKMVDGRMIYLKDVASAQYKEMPPRNYNRINGLNTIDLTINGNKDINTIAVAKEIKETMERLEDSCPENLTYSISFDASTRLEKEISTIFFRSMLSLAILLLFVLAVSRSWRYLFIIFVTIVVNLLLAVIFYYFGNIQIQLYSMAGITISLGIIIDTSIVMVDHYTYYHNRSVLSSIFGALLTTIASLSIIFFLPDQMADQLKDFVWVIIINLTISMLIAALFIPALLDKIPLKNRGIANIKIKRKRKIVKLSNKYYRYINWARKRRWAFIIVLILGFGIPIHLLPTKLGETKQYGQTKEPEKLNFWQEAYNSTIGGSWYSDNRKTFEIIFGGTFRMFSQNLNSSSYYREPKPRKELTARAAMPEGCTVQQLNEIIKSMENYVSQFPEIDMYRTNVNSATDGSITITFTEEAENTSFPFSLKQQIIQKATALGGATWYVSGIDENNFYNNVHSGYKQHSIELSGYNYDVLYGFAKKLQKKLSDNPRVKEPAVFGSRSSSPARSEFFIDYNKEKIASTGLDVGKYFGYLREQLYDNSLGKVFRNGEMVDVQLVSNKKDEFDLWHIKNDMIDIDSVKTRLTDVGTIEKRRTGNDINRHNQQYTLFVHFDFTGSYELAQKLTNKTIEEYNENILPIGYTAKDSRGNWWGYGEKAQQAWLIFLVIIIIYAICAIIFESLKLPIVIILMIPIGLIGLFLTFSLGEFTFDQGGFAAIVMLCGIVVNAGIYIVSEHKTVMVRSRKNPVKDYVTAYNRKIIPTLLTIISTVLGLTPFLFDGSDEVFWFAFAVGVMGGMMFSILALIFIMPVFIAIKKK